MPVSDDVNHALSALESVPEEPPGSVGNLQAELQVDDDFGKLKRRRRRRRRRRRKVSKKQALKRALDAQLRDWNKHLNRNGWNQMPLEKLNCPLLIKHRGIFGNKATRCTIHFCKRSMKKDLGCFKRTDYAKKRRRANKTKGKASQARSCMGMRDAQETQKWLPLGRWQPRVRWKRLRGLGLQARLAQGEEMLRQTMRAHSHQLW